VRRLPRNAAAAGVAAAALAGCMPVPPPDPEIEALRALEAAHRPLLECVQAAMQARTDFAGGLPQIVVDAGMAGQVQALRGKYLGDALELADADREAQVAATQAALLALGRYGGGADQPGENDRLRRMTAMVETTTTIATATGADCEPSDTLISLMEKAEK
jgi:hypothetical protein